MTEQKVRNITGALSRSSIFLSRSIVNSNRIERNLEKKSLVIKRKLVEERGRTLKDLASKRRGTGTGGVIGGALGLLGIGSGAGLLRRGLTRTPRSPNQLLRMQRGTSNLSRVRGLGRLAKPLAVVGTGLDFIGRRAEGQSNVQAGVGAAGGLAGSLAGAKAGAILGTAVGGPIGTVIGGAGGAIIGSLAGGRLADLFTGANRRRQFEEQRVLLNTQKTLFSDALDDFDNVLDKFEDVVGGLAIQRRRDDDDFVTKRRRFPKFPKLPSFREKFDKFINKPETKIVGTTALAALVVTAAVLSKGKTAKDPASIKIMEKFLAQRPFLRKLSEKEQIAAIGRMIMKGLPRSTQQKIRMSTASAINKRGTIVPGQKGAPGISKKGMEIRNLTKKERIELEAERLNIKLQRKIKKNRKEREFLKKIEKEDEKILRDIENDPNSKEIINDIVRQSGKDVLLDKNRLTRNAMNFIEKIKPQIVDRTTKSNIKKSMDSVNRRISAQRSELLDKIDVLTELQRLNPKESTLIRLNDAKRALKILEDFANKFVPKKIKQKGGFDVSSLNPDPDGTNIASLDPDLLILGNNDNTTTTPPSSMNINLGGRSTIATVNPYDAVAANIAFESSLTA